MKEQNFKNTEIGLIPEDWEVKKLGEICELINGRAYKQEELLKNGKYKVLRVGNFFSNGSWYWSNFELADKFYVNKGDLMYAWSASFGPKFWLDKKTIYHYHIWKINTKDEVYKNYLFHILEYDKEKILKLTQGGTMFHITKGSMEERMLPLPPLSEQEKIAEALSDCDGWIESIEQLIVKKRQLKQGAMQKLLSPKEDWEVRKLGEVGKCIGGLSGKSKEDFQDGNSFYIPFMNVMSNAIIDTNYLDKVQINKGENQNKILKDDLIFNGSSETPEEVGMCSVLLEDVPNLYLNSFCFGYRLFEQTIYTLFLSYLFRSNFGRLLMYNQAQGATRYNLSKANFLSLEIKIPNFQTQTEIATILSDMDAEIETLEEQLQKAKNIKLGMMQDLLTGKVRLV